MCVCGGVVSWHALLCIVFLSGAESDEMRMRTAVAWLGGRGGRGEGRELFLFSSASTCRSETCIH